MKDTVAAPQGLPFARLFVPRRAPPPFLMLVLLTALSTLTLNMFLPSLAHIAEAFQADYALVSLAVAGYLGVTAGLQLIIGPLSDRYGRRPVLLIALSVFTLASVGCTLAGSIYVFLGFRVLQGAVIASVTLSQAMVRDTSPPQEAASRLGYIAMAMAVAPMVGPMLGGVLDTLFGWRAAFVFYACGGLAMLCLCGLTLAETNMHRSATLGAQMRAYPDLIRARRFWGYAACMSLSTATFFSFIAGAPLVARSEFGMSGAALGAAIGSITGGFMFGSFLSARLARRVALTDLIVAGRLIACTGPALGGLLLLAGVLTPVSFFGTTILVGVGNGLTMPNANAGALSVRPHLAGSAAGLSGALVLSGGALMTGISGALVPEAAPAGPLLAVMEATTLAGLAVALWVRRREARLAAA